MSHRDDTLQAALEHNCPSIPWEHLEALKSGEDRDAWLRDLVEWLLQELLEPEFKEHLGAGRYERTDQRRGYRNGYRQRDLVTRVGRLTLRVPRDREGRFSTDLFERYQRSEKAMVLALQESYLQGVSTRKVKQVTEKLCGVQFSTIAPQLPQHSMGAFHGEDQVSRMAHNCPGVPRGELDEELAAWRSHMIAGRSLQTRSRGDPIHGLKRPLAGGGPDVLMRSPHAGGGPGCP